MTVVQARAIGNAVNLTSADLPGYSATPQQPISGEKQTSAQFAACVDGIGPADTIAKLYSAKFDRGSGLRVEQVESSVTVLRSASLATRELAADEGAGAQSCLAKSVLQGAVRASSSSIKYGALQISRIPTPPGATDGSVGYRFVVAVTSSGLRFQIYDDLLGFRAGPTGIGLETLRIGQAFPTSDETRLYSLLVSRAKAHLA